MTEYDERPTVGFSMGCPNPYWHFLLPLPSSSWSKIWGFCPIQNTSLTGARLFAFPSSSSGFSLKLFSSFSSCWISCSVFLSSDSFPFAFVFSHTHTETQNMLSSFVTLSLLLLSFWNLKQIAPSVSLVSPKMVSSRAPLRDFAVFHTGEHWISWLRELMARLRVTVLKRLNSFWFSLCLWICGITHISSTYLFALGQPLYSFWTPVSRL